MVNSWLVVGGGGGDVGGVGGGVESDVGSEVVEVIELVGSLSHVVDNCVAVETKLTGTVSTWVDVCVPVVPATQLGEHGSTGNDSRTLHSSEERRKRSGRACRSNGI